MKETIKYIDHCEAEDTIVAELLVCDALTKDFVGKRCTLGPIDDWEGNVWVKFETKNGTEKAFYIPLAWVKFRGIMKGKGKFCSIIL